MAARRRGFDRRRDGLFSYVWPESASECLGFSRGLGLSGLGRMVVGEAGIPFLEERPEFPIQRPRSGLPEQVRATLCPSHLLVLGEALADHRVDRGFGQT